MSRKFSEITFLDANQELVVYNGSPITWRISAYAFVEQGDELLIIKDRDEKRFDIVGGGIELGESMEQGLQRECLEEAGARIKIGRLLDVGTDWMYRRESNTFHQSLFLFYTAALVDTLGVPTEKSVEWVGFVPKSKIGKEYRLPPFVEKMFAKHIAKYVG